MIQERPQATAPAAFAELPDLDEQLAMDTSEGAPVFLLVGDGGTHLRLSPSARALLQRVRGGESFEQLAAAMKRGDGAPLSAAEVESTYRALVDKIAGFKRQSTQPAGLFWLRRRLISPRLAARLGRAGARAYRPLPLLLAGLAILTSVVVASAGHVLGRASPDDFWAAYALFLASVAVHELGHASACARFGASPGEIGVVMFFVYPSFYSDVNAAWKLKRWQRVVVDLGGIYFQLLFGCACLLAYQLTGWPPLRGTLLLIAGSCLFSLNPLLKFDGYWVVADALGVTNLSRQPARLLGYLVARLRRRTTRPLPWSPAVCASLALYSALAMTFWAWFLWHLIPALLTHCGRWLSFAEALGVELLALAPTWPSLRGFLTSSFMLLFVVMMLARLGGPLLGWALRQLRPSRPAPEPRGAS